MGEVGPRRMVESRREFYILISFLFPTANHRTQREKE